jgi:hypothetical protein
MQEIWPKIFSFDENQLWVRYLDEKIDVTPRQMKIICVLWKEIELADIPDWPTSLSEKQIIQRCFPDSPNSRVRHQFRNRTLWGTLIRSPKRGFYGLHLPGFHEISEA